MTAPVRCLIAQCDQPGEWTSPTGHVLCIHHHEIYQELELDREPEGLQPVNLAALMAGERPEEEWCVAPILPAGKLCGIVSKRGEGKSILLLEVAAAKACGLPVLSQPGDPPIHTVYIDMEMGPDDLYERLADLGYLPDHPKFDLLIEHLHYYQLVALPPLDTEQGGEALEELVDRHKATLVIIDTVSRVVTGAENEAEPYRELFRHTETRLKRKRVTMARLDHLGKDKERGSRGSSAKEDALDVVWHLATTATGAIELTLTKGRQGWLQKSVLLHRLDRAGIMAHQVHEDATPDWVEDIVSRLDELELPVDIPANKAYLALQKAGSGRRRNQVLQAIRVRRTRLKVVPKTPEPPLFEMNGNHPWEPPGTALSTQGTTPEPGNRGVVPKVPPPKGGYQGEPEFPEHPEDPDFEDFEPDPEDLPNPFEEL